MTDTNKSDPLTFTGFVCGDRFVDDDEFGYAYKRVAAGLIDLGLSKAASVGLLMRNDIEFMIAQFGAVAAGGNFIMLNWHAAVDEIAYVMQDADVQVLVVHADLLEPLRSVIPACCKILVVPTTDEVRAAFSLSEEECRVKQGDTNWTTWQQNYEPLADDKIRHSGTLGISYTSGTTGKPKGVERDVPDAAAVAKLYGIADEIFGVEYGQSVRVLVSAPVYHGAPNFFACRGSVPGSLSLLSSRFDAEKTLQLIEGFGITHMYMVPTTLIKLLDLPEDIRRKYDLSSLQRIIHGAAPCPREVKLQMIDWLGPVIYEFYGGTECGSIALLSSEEAIDRPGSVGKPLDNVVVEVCDEQGKLLPAGETGEIYARNFNTPRFKYRNLPEKQAEVERGELVSIGDIGYVDEDGFIYLCDRKRDMVISAGVNIYPAQLEAVLLGMPEVADCIIFGIPDPVFGEALCAHVQPKEGSSLKANDITEWMKTRVTPYQVPGTVVIDTALPREASGKIMKRKIRDKYWEEAGRKI